MLRKINPKDLSFFGVLGAFTPYPTQKIPHPSCVNCGPGNPATRVTLVLPSPVPLPRGAIVFLLNNMVFSCGLQPPNLRSVDLRYSYVGIQTDISGVRKIFGPKIMNKLKFSESVLGSYQSGLQGVREASKHHRDQF